MTPRAWFFTSVFAVMAALCITVAVQQARIGALRASLAHAEAEVANERAKRAQEALQHAQTLAAAAAEHATRQQEAEHVWNQEKARLAAGRRNDADLVRRLRAQIAAAVPAHGRAADHADPAAGKRQEHSTDDLAGILAEGVELVAEGRRLVEQRDSEVSRLLVQISADRAACAVGGEQDASRPKRTDLGH